MCYGFSMDTETETTAFTSQESLLLTRAIGAMPYGAMVSAPRGIQTAEDMVKYLDDLASVLRGIGERNAADGAELRQLRAQRDAMRAFLGTDQ